MEENEEYVSTGKGNPVLGEVCLALFEITGMAGYYSLAERMTEPAKEFDRTFLPDQENFLEQ